MFMRAAARSKLHGSAELRHPAPRGLTPARPQSIRAEARNPTAASLEAQADAAAGRIVGAAPSPRRGAGPIPAEAPALALAARSTSEPLDAATRTEIEPQLGVDLGGVRVHADAEAATAAKALDANAFTIDRDVYFGAGRYEPHGSEGRRLLAHELSHVVQQGGGNPERGLSATRSGVQRDGPPSDKPPDKDQDKGPKVQRTFTLPSELLAPMKLQPPSLLAPKPFLPFSGDKRLVPSLSLDAGASGGLPSDWIQQGGLTGLPPSLLPRPATAPLAPTTTPTAGFAPGSKANAPSATPSAPETITLKDFGFLSLAVRFGFPDKSKDVKPGEPLTALQESLRVGEILNYQINGVTPSFASLDVGNLIKVGYSIFATHIDPALAASLASKVSAKPSAGPKLSLDATVIFQTSPKAAGGGGLTATLTF
jgi:Domain of unknown function (DUF4157)